VVMRDGRLGCWGSWFPGPQMRGDLGNPFWWAAEDSRRTRLIDLIRQQLADLATLGWCESPGFRETTAFVRLRRQFPPRYHANNWINSPVKLRDPSDARPARGVAHVRCPLILSGVRVVHVVHGGVKP
jgi:hypothetical protein